MNANERKYKRAAAIRVSRELIQPPMEHRWRYSLCNSSVKICVCLLRQLVFAFGENLVALVARIDHHRVMLLRLFVVAR